MHVRHDRLQNRGWSPGEIEHLKGVLGRADKNKHKHLHFIEQILPATIFMVAIAGNVAFITLLLPLVFVLLPVYTYLFTLLLGASLGLMHMFLMREYEHLPTRHQFTPLLVVALFSGILLNHMIEVNQVYLLYPSIDAVIVGFLYGIAFLAAPAYRVLLHGD